MLKIGFQNASDRELVKQLRKKAPELLSTLTGKLTSLMAQLSAYIVSQKLSGQVLHRRTGILAGSVHAVPVTLRGNTLLGGVVAGSEGPSALYASVMEYGGTGSYEIVAVKARALSFIQDGKRRFAFRVSHPAAIARPYMSTSLAENAEDIQAELSEALNKELR